MPSYYKERGGWVCSYSFIGPDGNKNREKKRGFALERDAKRWYDSVASSLYDGSYSATEKMTVAQWLRRWYKVYCSSLAPATQNGYNVSIEKHLVPLLGSVKLVQLRPDMVQDLCNKLVATKRKLKSGEQRAYSAGHVKQIMVCLTTALNRAVFDGLITRNPCQRVKLPDSPKPERAYCTAEQARAVLDTLRQSAYYMPALLCVMLGLRRGEALGVKWDSLNFDTKTAIISNQITVVKGGVRLSPLKTKGSARTLALPDGLVEELKQHRKEQLRTRLQQGALYMDEGYVCATRFGGVQHPDDVSRSISRIMSGIAPGRTLHDLRHTYATLLRQHDVPIEVISGLLGHADVSTTYRFYVGDDEKAKKDAAAMIESVLKTTAE